MLPGLLKTCIFIKFNANFSVTLLGLPLNKQFEISSHGYTYHFIFAHGGSATMVVPSKCSSSEIPSMKNEIYDGMSPDHS